MPNATLEPRIVRMPEPAPGQWLNIARPLGKEQMLGNVVLLDFWDYTCVNCLRTLPYLVSWHRRYTSLGLLIVGVHAPEFKFAHNRSQVEAAIDEHEIPYPVLLDNAFHNWELFAIKAWPTKILIDMDGYIRLQRRGEGYYGEFERAIQTLLRHRDPSLSLPEVLSPLRAEDAPGAVCYRPTPELHTGVGGGGLFGGGLGNPEGYTTLGPVYYRLPEAKQREEGRFYLSGLWRAWPDALAYAGETRGQVNLLYSAATVNAVLSSSADPVDTFLEMRPTDRDPVVEVRQNGHYLSREQAGADVVIDEAGRSLIYVTRPRMYELVRNTNFVTAELELSFLAQGLALYSFTFSGCVAGPDGEGGDLTYTVQ
jgi:thiol-disulfide isomerase/thioredoxin